MLRTGTCKRCRGSGKLQRTDPVLMRKEVAECPNCDGEGASSDAMEFYAEDCREEMEQQHEEWLAAQVD